jgi:hypothetical protein
MCWPLTKISPRFCAASSSASLRSDHQIGHVSTSTRQQLQTSTLAYCAFCEKLLNAKAPSTSRLVLVWIISPNAKATAKDIGLTRKQIHEASAVRDAEKDDPVTVSTAKLAREAAPKGDGF